MMTTRKNIRRRRNTRKHQKGGLHTYKIPALLQNVSNTYNTNNLSPSASKLLYNVSLTMQRLKKVMKTYIASPWDENEKTFSIANYNRLVKEYTELTGNTLNTHKNQNKLCKSTINNTNIRKPFKTKLCRHHSGNLFEHSQWSALQIIQWKNEGDPIVKDIDINTAIIAAFFHDIGKGGDCVKTTNNTGYCWLDMYSDDKYGKQGNSVHPTYSADMILGTKMFRLTCNNNGDELNIKTLLETEFPGINIYEIALAAEMHWEFGKLNFPKPSESEKIHNYLSQFYKACIKCGNLEPSETLLRLCMAVSCADIAAGTNRRLLPDINGIIPAKETFISTDPWVLFGIDKKYVDYQKAVLKAYHNEVSKVNRVKRLSKINL